MSYAPKDKAPSTAAAVVSGAGFYQCYEGVETPEDHIIPRKSLSQQQHLGTFRTPMETTHMQGAQLLKPLGDLAKTTPATTRVIIKTREWIDPTNHNLGSKVVEGVYLTNGVMIPTTDERLVWKGDRTLLRRGIPDTYDPHQVRFQAPGSKRVISDFSAGFTPLPENLSEGMMIKIESLIVDYSYLGLKDQRKAIKPPTVR